MLEVLDQLALEVLGFWRRGGGSEGEMARGCDTSRF